MIIGFFLNFDEIRHFRDFRDLAEKLTNPLATCDSLRFSHVSSFVSRAFTSQFNSLLQTPVPGFQESCYTTPVMDHGVRITGPRDIVITGARRKPPPLRASSSCLRRPSCSRLP